MEVSFSPDMILSGWLASKHQLTNYSLKVHEAPESAEDGDG